MLNKSVLLVDYEPKGLNSMKAYLEGLGLEVDTATDGSMALARFFDRKPDMVVMSPMLPKIHGFDVCRQITQSPEGKDVPVIIVTAVYKGSKYRNEAIHSCGARAYFEKPYAEDELTDTIYKLLNIKRDKPAPPRSAVPSVERSLEEILPELKGDRTMPFIKKSDVLATLQLERQKAKVEEPRKAAAAVAAEEKFVTSEEIFGDVIDSFESGKKAAAARAPSVPAEPARPIEPIVPTPVPQPAPAIEVKPQGKIQEAAAPIESTLRMPAPTRSEVGAMMMESIDDLAKVDYTAKKAAAAAPVDRDKADIERKLEETLSGLSLDRPRAKPPRPATAPKPQPPAPIPAAKIEPPVPPRVEPAPPAPAPPKVAAPPPAPVEVVVPKPPVRPPAPLPSKVATPAPMIVETPVPRAPAPEPVKAAAVSEPVRPVAPPLEPKPVQMQREERPSMPSKYGEYVLLEKIATGGMAELFKAKRSGPEGFEKILAIKRILPHLSDNEEFVTMFIDEAKVAAQLNHPNIVHIYDLGRIEDSYFIAMEFVLGRDLRTIIKELDKRNRTVPYELAAYIGLKICDALEYAHRKLDYSQKPLNIVHRDVSPQNILISYEGEVKLVDFGVAKAASKAHHTTHGALKGKILYMSPEQAWGKSLDHRSDIFSLGSVLFETSTGRKLFLGDSEISTLEAVRNGKVVPPTALKKDFPKPLEDAILKALRSKADERFGSASEMEKTLEGFLETIHSRPSPGTLSEFMFELFPEEMKAKGIRFEPRKATPPPKQPELTIRVDKPEVKVPPPKVIPVVEKPPASAPSPAKEPAVARAAAVEQEVNFKPILDTGIHTQYRKQRSRLMAIVGILGTIVLIGGLVSWYFSREKEAPPPSPGKTAQATTPDTGTPTAGGSQPSGTPSSSAAGAPSTTTPPTTGVTPPKTDEQKRAEEELRRKADEERQKQLQAQEQIKKQQQEEEAKKAEDEKQAELQRQEQAAADEKKRLEDEATAKKKADDEVARKAEEDRQAQLAAQASAKQAEVKEGDIVPINQVDSQPLPAARPSPVYPDVAKRSNIQGRVKLSILVSETGNVVDVKILSGTGGKIALLNEAAVSAVKRWKYQPATKNGKRVKVWLNVELPFVLH